jgi:hypothetical protein
VGYAGSRSLTSWLPLPRGYTPFFESGECREDDATPRVTRWGTHALTATPRTKLWTGALNANRVDEEPSEAVISHLREHLPR